MEESQLNENTRTEKNKKDEQFFSNVFSQISKFEKNKRYQQLQLGLISLQQDLKLMEDFSNNRKKLPEKKINFIKKLNLLNNDKDKNKRNLSRGINGMFFRRRMSIINNSNEPSNNNLSIVTNENNKNNGNTNIFKSINEKNKEIKKINIKKNSKYNSQKKNNINPNNEIYKTELKNYDELINGEKLPNIYNSTDKTFESNLDNFNTNTNTNSSTLLPIIPDRGKNSLEKILNLTSDKDIDDDNHIYINENINKSHNYKNYKIIPSFKRKKLRDNLILQKFPKILKSPRLGSGINRQELAIQTKQITKNMQDKNTKIKERINSGLLKQNLVNWEMKSKFKLAEWKYGIADVEKYFIDLKAYGKPEEDELDKRKTFFDLVEDVIGDIKTTKDEREIKSIEDKYNEYKSNKKKVVVKEKDNKKKEEKKKNNNIYELDNTLSKKDQLSDMLKMVELRQIKEQKTRDKINKILFKCDLRQKTISDSVDKLVKSKNLLNTNHEFKKEKSNNSLDIDNFKEKEEVNEEDNEEDKSIEN